MTDTNNKRTSFTAKTPIKKKKKLKLSSLAGLGSDIWKSIHIEQYVENERNGNK